MFWDAEIAFARLKDLGFDVGYIRGVPYELPDDVL